MTVPLDTVNDIRSMDAAGRSRSEIARMLHVSRNTVAKYADMGDMSPAAPMPQRRGRPALEGDEEWVAGVLEADLGAPGKQRHTARRIYDRLVAERGYGGSYSTVQGFVREPRLARAAGGEGYLELEWAPSTCQVDFGNSRAAVGGRTLDLKLPVATLPHSNGRQCVAPMCRGRGACAPDCSRSSTAGAAPRRRWREARSRNRGCSRSPGPTTASRAGTATPIRETGRVPSRTPWGSSGATSSSLCRRPARLPSPTRSSPRGARGSTRRRTAAAAGRTERPDGRTSPPCAPFPAWSSTRRGGPPRRQARPRRGRRTRVRRRARLARSESCI